MIAVEIIAPVLGAVAYAWCALQWAAYLRFWGGFIPAAAVWPVLQVYVWIKGDPHKRGL
jgi:hypothetical protein